MSIKDQSKQLKLALDTSQHKFVNMLSNAIANRVSQICNDLKLSPTGRSASETKINLVLNGQMISDEIETVKDKIDDYMNVIKNEVELLKHLE